MQNYMYFIYILKSKAQKLKLGSFSQKIGQNKNEPEKGTEKQELDTLLNGSLACTECHAKFFSSGFSNAGLNI